MLNHVTKTNENKYRGTSARGCALLRVTTEMCIDMKTDQICINCLLHNTAMSFRKKRNLRT